MELKWPNQLDDTCKNIPEFGPPWRLGWGERMPMSSATPTAAITGWPA
jgi:hypothetical protein